MFFKIFHPHPQEGSESIALKCQEQISPAGKQETHSSTKPSSKRIKAELSPLVWSRPRSIDALCICFHLSVGQIRIEAPQAWDFQPLCNLYQARQLFEDSQESFQNNCI